MDNSTLLTMIESLISDIEYCFDIDDVNTSNMYDCKKASLYGYKKNLTLFEFLEDNRDNGCVGLYSFYQNYQKIKAHLEFINQIESIEIIRAKVNKALYYYPIGVFIRQNQCSFSITHNEVIFVMPTQFFLETALKHKQETEKAFSQILSKPMIVKFVVNQSKFKVVNRPKLPDIDIDDDLPF